MLPCMLERDVAPWHSVRSWFDGSAGRSLTVEPLSYVSFQSVYNDKAVVCAILWDGAYY